MPPCPRPSAAPCSCCSLWASPVRVCAGGSVAPASLRARWSCSRRCRRNRRWPTATASWPWPARWSRASASMPIGPPPRSWPACPGWAWPWPRPSSPSGRPRVRSGRSRGSTGSPGSVPDCSRPSPPTSRSPARRPPRSRQHPGSSHDRYPLTGGLARVPDAGGAPPVNLNTATLSDLDNLPGIGPARAAAILQEREARGPFASVEELSRVPGLGPAAITRLRDRVVVQ